MLVTLDTFSGRPNPTWRLTPAQVRQLVDRGAAQLALHPDQLPPKLGYRGLVLQTEPYDPVADVAMPPRFAIAQPVVPPVAEAPQVRRQRARAAAPPAEAQARTEGADLTNWLLQTAEGAVDDTVLEAVLTAVQEGTAHRTRARVQARSAAAVEGEGEQLATGQGCEPFLTPMWPAFWNYTPVRLRNNCYNYASNCVSNTLAQPGRRAGLLYTAFDCDAVRIAAMADGCSDVCDGSYRIIALAIWPGTDFHWYRLHPGGYWAHKLGWTEMTNLDNSGRIIGNGLTPATCDRGPYTTFCTYLYAPLGMWVL